MKNKEKDDERCVKKMGCGIMITRGMGHKRNSPLVEALRDYARKNRKRHDRIAREGRQKEMIQRQTQTLERLQNKIDLEQRKNGACKHTMGERKLEHENSKHGA